MESLFSAAGTVSIAAAATSTSEKSPDTENFPYPGSFSILHPEALQSPLLQYEFLLPVLLGRQIFCRHRCDQCKGFALQ